MSEAWDESAWEALANELCAWQDTGRPATFWWRDDDAGGPHPALTRLLDLAAAAAVPVALAVVPAWLEPEVCAGLAATRSPVDLLQHGFAHANHESAPTAGVRLRPAECGPARPAALALAEIAEGRRRLAQALGDRALPVFVPPWNRIAPDVVAGLTRAGFRSLSTFAPRARADVAPGLRQVNCHVDPILWRQGKRFAGAGVALARIRVHLTARRLLHVDPDEPTGILTHHRDQAPEGWAFLAELWSRLSVHPAAAFPRPAAFLVSPSGS